MSADDSRRCSSPVTLPPIQHLFALVQDHPPPSHFPRAGIPRLAPYLPPNPKYLLPNPVSRTFTPAASQDRYEDSQWQTAVYPAPTPNIPMVCPTRTDAWHDGRAFTIIPDELGTFNARVGVVDFALHSCAPHAPPGVAMTELLAGEGCLQDPDASVLMCSPRWSISLSLPFTCSPCTYTIDVRPRGSHITRRELGWSVCKAFTAEFQSSVPSALPNIANLRLIQIFSMDGVQWQPVVCVI